MDFSAFLSAYFSDWVGWMSGIGSVVLAVWGFLRPRRDQKRSFLFMAAAIAFIVAPIHIWTLEHRARLNAEDVSKPKLSAAIDVTMWGSINGFSSLTLDVSLMNTGAPSIARYQKLLVTLPSGKELTAKILPMSSEESIPIPGPPGMPPMTLKSDEYLVRRALNSPIPQGGGISGWIRFVVPDAPLGSFDHPGTRLTLKFLDVDFRNPVTATDILTGRSDTGNVYIPSVPILQAAMKFLYFFIAEP